MNEAIYSDDHGELLTYEQTAKRSNLGINSDKKGGLNEFSCTIHRKPK